MTESNPPPAWPGQTTSTDTGPATPPPAVPPPAAPSVTPLAQAPVRASTPRRRVLVDVVLVVAAMVAIGGIGFGLGRVTAPEPAVTALSGRSGNVNGLPGFGNGFGNGFRQVPGQGQNGNGLPGNGGTGNGFGAAGRLGGLLAIKGEVTEVAADHLTVKLASGQTVRIAIDSSTAFHKQAAGSASDVTQGSQVLVQLKGRTAGAGASGGASDVTVVTP